MTREEAEKIKAQLLRRLKGHPPGDPRDAIRDCLEILGAETQRKSRTGRDRSERGGRDRGE